MLATLLPLLSDGLLISRADGHIEHANPAACELLGCTESALQGAHESQVWRPREAHDVLRERRVGAFIRGRATITRPNGTEEVIEYLSTVVAKGESQQACTLLRPIRDPAHLTEELDRQARRFRTMFNGLREAVCFLTPIRGADGNVISFAYLEANAAMERQLGAGPLSGRSMEDVVGPEIFRERVADRVARYAEVLRTGEPWEYEALTNGRFISVRVFRQADDVVGVASLDLTEQLATGRALVVAEQREADTAEELRAVLDAVPAAVWIARDVQANHIDSNAYGQRLLRTPDGANVSISAPGAERPRHFTPMRDGKPIPEDDLPIQHSARFGRSVRDAELDLVFEDGEVRHLLGGSEPLRDGTGQVRGAVGAFIDITARRRNEQALTDSLARFDAFMKALPAIAFVKDTHGRMLYLNPFAEQVLGLTRGDWYNRSALELFPPEMAGAVEHDDAQALASDAPHVTLRRTEDMPSGTVRWWNTIRFAIRETAGRPLLAGISIDVTEQQRTQEALKASEARAREAQRELEQAIEVSRRTEEKFRQAQKMEAVGRLAGGIAHDFNNLLTVILGNGELLAEKLRQDPGRLEIDEVLGAGRRASDLTRQLLAFSRKQALEPRVLNLNTVVSGMEQLLRRLLGEDIELAVLLSQRLHLTRVDPGQMEQVLLNLAVNARDAMPSGGRMTIETSNVVLDDEYVRTHPEATSGRHAMLSVSDTGIGMSREVQSHLFEPFFTTKEQGKGTGLGLSTVYGIVRQSGGTIWVYSEPGQGSIFKVYLPLAGDVEDPLPIRRTDLTTLRGTETILLVEDDATVRRVLSAILKRAGYHVIEAANGGEALLICEQHGGAIPLMLTDIVMPKMNGRQLAERLRRIRPELLVVFMSGYTENVVVHHGVVDSGIDFLQKPLTAEVLLPKIREVLDRRVAGT